MSTDPEKPPHTKEAETGLTVIETNLTLEAAEDEIDIDKVDLVSPDEIELAIEDLWEEHQVEFQAEAARLRKMMWARVDTSKLQKRPVRQKGVPVVEFAPGEQVRHIVFNHPDGRRRRGTLALKVLNILRDGREVLYFEAECALAVCHPTLDVYSRNEGTAEAVRKLRSAELEEYTGFIRAERNENGPAAGWMEFSIQGGNTYAFAVCYAVPSLEDGFVVAAESLVGSSYNHSVSYVRKREKRNRERDLKIWFVDEIIKNVEGAKNMLADEIKESGG